MKKIQMVDLHGQYLKIKDEIDTAMQSVIVASAYINGPEVARFASNLSEFLSSAHVIPCANGTDALQLALMSLGLQPGDEVICPNFTFIASVEAVALLGLKPVLVDVDADTFNINSEAIRRAITPKTKAIIPVHLFGQCCNMNEILAIAEENNLYVIEDTAQALGCNYSSNSLQGKAGTLGTIGCTSFFPSKNLGCFGDGGAVFTNSDTIAEQLKMYANHGSKKKYFHSKIGINSRLDSIQAAVLNVKLNYLQEFNSKRIQAANRYDSLLGAIDGVQIPKRVEYSGHVFHQYTLKLENKLNTDLQAFLKEKGIPSMIYYPKTMAQQDAFVPYLNGSTFPISDELTKRVISLPMHTELSEEHIEFICAGVKEFFE